MEEDIRDLLYQLPPSIILMRDFNAHIPLWGSKKWSRRGKMLEQILDKINFLCLNETEETYYRTYDGYKLTIDLTLANINNSRNDLEQGVWLQRQWSLLVVILLSFWNCIQFSLFMFGEDFPFIFYDNGEVITSWVCILFSICTLELWLGWQVLGLLLICSHRMLFSSFLLFHLGTRGCIYWGFSPTFSFLCSFFQFPTTVS